MYEVCILILNTSVANHFQINLTEIKKRLFSSLHVRTSHRKSSQVKTKNSADTKSTTHFTWKNKECNEGLFFLCLFFMCAKEIANEQ